MDTRPDPLRKRPRWVWWSFVLLNVAGLAVIVPLLKAVWPLLMIWWRPPAPPLESTPPTVAAELSATNWSAHPMGGDTNATFQTLTNQLGLLQNLSDSDLGQIMAQQFGGKAVSATPTNRFDLGSAVFDSISRTNLTFQGTTYYGYIVKLVDQNGNQQTNVDLFTEPNPDYERSLATMELINKSPQLRRIYQAMAPMLAEKTGGDSTSPTNAPAAATEPKP